MNPSANPVTVEDLLAHSSWARRLAVRLVSDADVAEDLLQDTWIASLDARPDGRRSLRPWLATVLRNRALNRRRAEQRRQAHHQQASEAAAAPAVGPEELLGRLQVQQVLAELVTALAEPHRQTVLFRYYEGLTSEEIGRAMDVPAGTVRRRLKEAVDQLRLHLDHRFARRDDWRRALAPLVPLARGVSRGVMLAGLSFGLLLCFGLFLVVRGRAGGPAGGGPAGHGVVDTDRGDRGSGIGGRRLPGGADGRSFAAVAVPATLDGCRQALAQRRKQVAIAEGEFVETARADLLFNDGTPNPVGRKTLLPDLERVMGGDAGPAPSFSLECRTRACRMLVLEPDGPGEQTHDWMQTLQRDPVMMERTRGMGFFAGAPTKDPVSGAPLTEKTVYLALNDQNATRVPRGAPPPPAPADTRPLPDRLPACQAQLQAADQRLAHLREIVQRDMNPMERFETSTLNPQLTAQMAPIIARVLAGGPVRWESQVECRDRVCRVSVPTATTGESANDWREKLQSSDELQRYTGTVVVGREVFYEIADPTRPFGMDILNRLVDELKASPALAVCTRRFPTTGRLELRYFIPDAERPEPDSEPGRITVRLGGVVSGTPLARCVEDQALAPLLAKPPERVRGAMLFSHIDFPLGSKIEPRARR